MSREDFDNEVESWAEFQLKCTLAVDAIAKAENITVTEEEYQAGLETLADESTARSRRRPSRSSTDGEPWKTA